MIRPAAPCNNKQKPLFILRSTKREVKDDVGFRPGCTRLITPLNFFTQYNKKKKRKKRKGKKLFITRKIRIFFLLSFKIIPSYFFPLLYYLHTLTIFFCFTLLFITFYCLTIFILHFFIFTMLPFFYLSCFTKKIYFFMGFVLLPSKNGRVIIIIS